MKEKSAIHRQDKHLFFPVLHNSIIQNDFFFYKCISSGKVRIDLWLPRERGREWNGLGA